MRREATDGNISGQRSRVDCGSVRTVVKCAIVPSTEEPTTVVEARRPTLAEAVRDTLLVRTPSDALHLEEARRTLLITAFMYMLVVVVTALMFAVGGDPTYRAIQLAGLGVAAVASTWVTIVARDAGRYRPYHGVLLGHAGGIAVATAYPYWGMFTATLMAVPMVLLFGLGKSVRGSASVLIAAMVLHALVSSLTILHVIPDRGIVRLSASNLSVPRQILLVIAVQLVLVTSYVLARHVRGATVEALQRLDDAARELAQREAIIGEARLDLREVLQLGGVGVYSDKVVGDFRVGVIIGRGAMGEVYEAERMSTGQRCALKLLHAYALRDDADALRRFQREACIAASLDVEHVIKVIAISPEGEVPPYIAMEILDGEDLAKRLKDKPVMPLGEVVDLVRQLGIGLEAARRAGIVHRDLKPQNVFGVKQPDGAVLWKILDFGMSKLVAHHHGTLTRGRVVGTPSYMAPEQARGDEVDHRTDLYALGVIAYRALTGRPVVAPADVPKMLFDVVYSRPPAPSSIARLPAAVDLVLAIALAKEPRDRFDSGVELASHLAAAAIGTLQPDVVRRAEVILLRTPWGARAHGFA